MKKVLSCMLALGLLFCALAGIVPVYSAATDEPPKQCGDDVWYTYNSDTDVLTIFGTGPMWDYAFDGWRVYSPFLKYRYVVIEEGVTGISDYVFYHAKLETISLPESLESIGEEAFYWSALAEIAIPKNVQYIGANVFTYTEIEEFQVAPQNSWFRSVGGVLFTADMKTLMAYPHAAKTKHYTVPKGVEVIANSAFCAYAREDLETISFPDSLRIIGDYAFLSQLALRDVRLPPNLEHIGHWSLDVYSFACIEISSTVLEIEEETFSSSKNISEIYFLGTPPILGENIYWPLSEGVTLLYPAALASAWAPNGETTYQGYKIAPYSYEKGDANCDGKVSAADAAAILRHLVDLYPLYLRGRKVADVTGDGQVTAADAARILRWLVDLEPNL